MSSAEFNPYAAPTADLTPPIVSNLDGLWRDGKLLIARRESVFPDRCVKCNAPAHGYRLTRTLFWHNPGWYLLVVLNVILYVIVALLVRKSVTVQFGLCPDHVRARKKALLLACLLALIGLGLMIAGVGAIDNRFHSIPVWAGFAMIIASPIYGVIARQSLAPKRIDATFAKLRGAGPDFLAELPAWDDTWTGYSPASGR